MTEKTDTASYRFGRFLLQPAQRRLLRDGAQVELEAKVFDLILLLLEHRDRALSKQEVVDALWGRRPVTDTALSQLLYKARRALNDDGDRQSAIRTVHGRGLQWVAPLETSEGGAAMQPVATTTVAPAISRHSLRWLAAAIVLLGVGAALLRLIPHAMAPPVPATPRVAVLPLDNATGDKDLEWTVRGLPGLIGSLLDDHGDLTVVDALNVARAWQFSPTAGRSHADHVRYVTGADIVVAPKLVRLAEQMYELRVHVDAGSLHRADDIVLDGPEPARLGADAAPRIRRALGLASSPQAAFGSETAHGYMAETFARGMDLAGHGDWQGALPYFQLVARDEPGFLPGQLRLGEAQSHTDQMTAADATLGTVLRRATAQGQATTAASALLQIANLDLLRHQYESALQRLQRAATLAAGTGDVDLRVSIALKTAHADAALHRIDDATAALAQARRWVAEHALPERDGDIANIELSLAEARGDLAAAERAGRAALAASEAIGNDSNARIDSYNLALTLLHENRLLDALPLLASVWQRAQRTQQVQLVFGSGDNLAIGLLNAGDAQRAAGIARQLQAIGSAQGNATWQALGLMLRAGTAWYTGDAGTTLELCRQADALINDEDPALRINLWLEQAPAALAVEPESLAQLAQRADTLAARQPVGHALEYERKLIHALADAATGDTAAARKALADAAATPPAYDTGLDNLRSTAFAIALHAHDANVAAIALKGFDVDRANNADLLRLAAAWAAQSGDVSLQHSAEARRVALKQSAYKALADAGIDLDATAPLAGAGAGKTH
jgi:DNA-binding winged helix-turn-helix (wHTH) protein